MARFGIIGDQYFDDAGDPLIAGKLFFYDSGTLTAKDTFSDVNLSIANTNPVILTAAGRQPDIFFNGSAKVILKTSADVQIEVRDPIGGSLTGNFDNWNSLTIYSTGDIVVGSDNKYYRSFTDGNDGNDPTTTPTEWEQIEFLRTWNLSVTYELNEVVRGSDGLFYRSLIGTNLNNDPVSSPTQWGSTFSETTVSPELRAAMQASSLLF